MLKLRRKPSSEQLPATLTIYAHPALIRTLYVFHDDSKLFYVYERLPGVPLLQFMLRKRNNQVNLTHWEGDCRVYIAQLLTVIAHLEKHGFIFRDFRPDCVLLGGDGRLIVAPYYDDWDDATFASAATAFLAPEILTTLSPRRKFAETKCAPLFCAHFRVLTCVLGTRRRSRRSRSTIVPRRGGASAFSPTTYPFLAIACFSRLTCAPDPGGDAPVCAGRCEHGVAGERAERAAALPRRHLRGVSSAA